MDKNTENKSIRSPPSTWLRFRRLEEVLILGVLRIRAFASSWKDFFDPNKSWMLQWMWSSLQMKILSLQIKLLGDQVVKKKLLSWILSVIPADLELEIPASFQDGILLCNLMQIILNGSCPTVEYLDPDQRLENLQLAFYLIETYLFVKPEIKAEEILEMTPKTEKKLLMLITKIKSAAEKFDSLNRGKHKELVSQNFYRSNRKCLLKGMGLLFAVQGRKAYFTILIENDNDLDFTVEIRGPKSSDSIMTITNTSSFAESKRPNLKNCKDGTICANYSRNNIPLRYRIMGEKICIEYIPIEIGVHSLSIIRKDQHVRGSPYTLTVSNSTLFSDTWPLYLIQRNYQESIGLELCEISGPNDRSIFLKCSLDTGATIRNRFLNYVFKVENSYIVPENLEKYDQQVNIQTFQALTQTKQRGNKFSDVEAENGEEFYFGNYKENEAPHNHSIQTESLNRNDESNIDKVVSCSKRKTFPIDIHDSSAIQNYKRRKGLENGSHEVEKFCGNASNMKSKDDCDSIIEISSISEKDDDKIPHDNLSESASLAENKKLSIITNEDGVSDLFISSCTKIRKNTCKERPSNKQKYGTTNSTHEFDLNKGEFEYNSHSNHEENELNLVKLDPDHSSESRVSNYQNYSLFTCDHDLPFCSRTECKNSIEFDFSRQEIKYAMSQYRRESYDIAADVHLSSNKTCLNISEVSDDLHLTMTDLINNKSDDDSMSNSSDDSVVMIEDDLNQSVTACVYNTIEFEPESEKNLKIPENFKHKKRPSWSDIDFLPSIRENSTESLTNSEDDEFRAPKEHSKSGDTAIKETNKSLEISESNSDLKVLSDSIAIPGIEEISENDNLFTERDFVMNNLDPISSGEALKMKFSKDFDYDNKILAEHNGLMCTQNSIYARSNDNDKTQHNVFQQEIMKKDVNGQECISDVIRVDNLKFVKLRDTYEQKETKNVMDNILENVTTNDVKRVTNFINFKASNAVVNVKESAEEQISARCPSVRKVIQMFQKEKEDIDYWPSADLTHKLKSKKLIVEDFPSVSDSKIKRIEIEDSDFIRDNETNRLTERRCSITDCIKFFEKEDTEPIFILAEKHVEQPAISVKEKKSFFENVL